MKIKNKKRFGHKHKVYKNKIGNMSFQADVYEDGSGELIGKTGKSVVVLESSGKLQDWEEKYEDLLDFYHNLVEFLGEVRYLRKSEDPN